MRAAICALVFLAAAPSLASAAEVSVSNAWVKPNEVVGSDFPLLMTIRNDGAEADALLRISCTAANFSEKRTMDVGEGGLSARVVPNIATPAHAETKLTEKTQYVALLQLREKLAEGQSFTCNLSFKRAGALEAKVSVSRSEPNL